MISGFVTDLPMVVQLLAGQHSPATEALESISLVGDTVLIPVTVLSQAAIIADPPPDQFMWLYGFRCINVADLTSKEAFRVYGQARHAPRPYEVPVHHAHTAYLAMTRGWPIITADATSWSGYGHLELVQV